MKMKLAALMGLAMGATFASAVTLNAQVTFTGDIDSVDGIDSANNVYATFDLFAFYSGQYTNFTLTKMGYDVTITAEGFSWLSEAKLLVENTSMTDGVILTPGFGVNTPGTGSYSSGGLIDLVALGLDVTFDNDDLMQWQFFESFDDGAGRDGFWHAGSTIDLEFEATAVPEPATMAVLGLGAAALLRRRRK